MFNSINRTIFDIPLTWDRTRFESSRGKCRQARKLIEASVNAQYNKQLKDLFFQKLDVENTIVESQQRLLNQEKKMRALENLTEVASQSLDDYFDKRMEHVRTAIQEHCDAIRQILREENDHWQEIHTAIDQNLITKEDLHPPKPVEEETPLANIHTIDEVDEEEQTSKLLNNKTVTPLLTQMIRKSRMRSIRPSANISTEALVRSKEEQMSVMLPLTSARRTLTVIDTTFVVKHEQSQATEPDESYQAEVEVQPAAPSPATNIIPIQSAPMTTVTPLESVPTPEAETTSNYSQPKPPARLYFSPTLLLDDDETGPIQPVLSTVDQNKTNNDKPKAATRRFGQTFLLDNVKTEEVDESQDAENIRPKISDEIPFLFQADPTMLMDKPSMIEPNSELVEVVELQKSIVYTKRRTNALVEPKVEPEPIHMTRRATRQRKQVVEPEAVARPTRKRKQSASDHDDGKEDNVALRKKKPGRQPAKSTTRKPRAKKVKEIPIRELSPLPLVDRSKHYSTRFSTRSHRFNNLTLSTTAATLHDDEADDDDHIKTKSKRSLVKSRAKSTRRTRHHDNDEPALPVVVSTNKKQPKTRAKSAITTRTRKK